MTKHMASSCGNLLYHCIFWHAEKKWRGRKCLTCGDFVPRYVDEDAGETMKPSNSDYY